MTTPPPRTKTSAGSKSKPAPAAPAPALAPAEADAPRPPRPRDRALALLRRAQGATMLELTAATGWLPHSTRAIISGLRKQGHVIVRSKRGTETCYTLVGEA